jgi:hypothetical protein
MLELGTLVLFRVVTMLSLPVLLLWVVGLLLVAAYVANNSAATMLSISNAGIQYVAGNATAEVSRSLVVAWYKPLGTQSWQESPAASSSCDHCDICAAPLSTEQFSCTWSSTCASCSSFDVQLAQKLPEPSSLPTLPNGCNPLPVIANHMLRTLLSCYVCRPGTSTSNSRRSVSQTFRTFRMTSTR